MESTPAEYQLTIDRSKTVAGLSLAAAMLLLIHAVLTVYHYQVEEIAWLPWRQLFDVDTENNLPTWFSGFVLSIAALWTWLLADHKREAADRWALHWRVLAVGLFVMSLDEIAGLHESFNSVTETTWAIPGGILAMVIGLSYFPFLWNLPTATRNAFAVAGLLFVSGAVGVEMIGAPMVEDAMPYNLVTVVEEGLEMFSVIYFLSALLKHMATWRKSSGGLTVEVTISD